MTPIGLYRLPTITYTPAQTAADVCVYTLIPTAIAFRSIIVFKQLISTSFKIEFQSTLYNYLFVSLSLNNFIISNRSYSEKVAGGYTIVTDKLEQTDAGSNFGFQLTFLLTY